MAKRLWDEIKGINREEDESGDFLWRFNEWGWELRLIRCFKMARLRAPINLCVRRGSIGI